MLSYSSNSAGMWDTTDNCAPTSLLLAKVKLLISVLFPCLSVRIFCWDNNTLLLEDWTRLLNLFWMFAQEKELSYFTVKMQNCYFLSYASLIYASVCRTLPYFSILWIYLENTCFLNLYSLERHWSFAFNLIKWLEDFLDIRLV